MRCIQGSFTLRFQTASTITSVRSALRSVVAEVASAEGLKNEIRQSFVLYPNVESLAAERQGDYVGFFNPSDACVFLEGDNRCRAEREYGKAAKPTNRSPTESGRLRRRVGGAAREAALTLRA